MWPPAYDDAETNLSESSSSLPGGGYYADITQIVEDAANAMATGDLIMSENFTLFDAMSAVQIMDARLDSSLATYQGAGTAKFDVFTALSPEEVCWVMEKTICAEMEWHQGHSLSQTIYTCLYFFEFSSLSPDTWSSSQSPDPSRPSALITSVLRSWMQGLIKTCDMAWREYAQRHVYENEDVISNKSELSLMEGTRVDVAIESLESAKRWLLAHPSLPWAEDLIMRLELRSLLLQVFAHPPRSDASQWRSLIISCKQALATVRSRPSPATPSINSSAFATFDPAICRNLVNHIPLPVIELMPIDTAWKVLEDMLVGLERSCVLEGSNNLLTWKIYLTLSSHEADSLKHSAYVRSRTTTSFTLNGTKIFNEHPREWIVPEILRVIADVPPSVWDPFTHDWDNLLSSRASYGARIWTSFQRAFCDSLVTYYKTLSSNRPRQRRTFSKNVAFWRDLLQLSVHLPDQLSDFPEAASMSRRVPTVILHLWLEQMAEVLFAGFEAELYALEEMPFLYWYTSTVVLSRQAETLDELRRQIHVDFPGSHGAGQSAAHYVRTQFTTASALKAMSEAAFLDSTSRCRAPESLAPSLKRILRRRLEWAFQAQTADTAADRSIPPPSFEQYTLDVVGISSQTADAQQLGLWRRAHDLLTRHETQKDETASTNIWELEHSRYTATLQDVCSKKIARLEGEMLQGHTPVADGVHNAQTPIHPWFPLI